MFGRFRGRLLWALLVVGALTACVAVPAALAQPPFTLTIQNVGTSTNVSCAGSPTMTCVATGDGAVLSTTDLDSDLNDPTVTKVVVGDSSTTTTIVVDDPVSGTNPLEFAAAAETTGSVTLQAPTVTFDDGVTGTGGLTISGNAVFNGSSTIDSVDVNGTARLAGSISTTASQTYADAVTLTGATTLATTGGTGQVTFDSTVDGGSSLTLTGNVEFDGVVGGSIELSSVSASGATTLDADVSTSGTQSYAGATTLGATPLALSGSKITFPSGSTLDGATALTINGDAEFDGTVGASHALTSLSVNGNTTLDGALTTTGDQSYTGATTLAGNSTLTETQIASSVTFDSTVNGAFGLSVTGNAEFDGTVGTTPLTSLSVSGATTLGASITTTGGQTYTGAVTLTSGSTEAGNLVKFKSTVNGAFGLTVTGNAEFDGTVGGTTALTSLSVSGATTLGANITTTGNQTYTGAVTLASGSTDAGSLVKFKSTVDGAFGLSVTGNAEFDSTVGTTPLTSLSVSGATTLGASITTTGGQTYTGAVTLTSGSTEAGNLVKFKSTVNGAFGLSITGNAELDGTGGGTTALTSLSVSGNTTLDASINTTGNQTYTGAVTLTSGSTEAGNLVKFKSTVNGAFGLTVTGNAEFDGTVGGTTALTSLSVSGATTLGANITTTGNQTYTGAVTLTSGSTDAGSLVKFKSTVDGAFGLSVTGNAEFDGTVGTTPLTSLSVSGATTLGASITTTGGQTYTGAVTLAAAVSLSTGASGMIVFNQVVGGSGALSMVGAGTLELKASNTYNGGTHADAGTVEFVNGGLGSGHVTLDGGTLEWGLGNTQDISLVLQPIGASGGTLNTNGNNISFANAIGNSGGTLVKAGAGTLSLAAVSGGYGSQLSIVGGRVSVDGTTVTTPIAVQSGGSLSCSANGTLSGGVTNNGGTVSGAPDAPLLTNVTAPGPTATVSFTGAANCLPITYAANTTTGGLASNPGAGSPLSLSGLAASTTYTFTVTATNPIGSTVSVNSLSATTPDPPAISFSSPASGASYLFNQTVDARYTCTDSTGPGVSNCQGSPASGAALDTSAPGQHSLTVTATSSDGYTSTQTVDYTVAKPLLPVITVVNPVSGGKYSRYQRVVASYSCLDSALGTGIASCSGSSASGSALNTSTLGEHSFTVQAISKDGATATLTVSYTVAAPANAFSLVVGARPHGAIRVTLGNVSTPGVVKLTIRRPAAAPFTLTRTIRSGSGFTYTLNATAALRRSLARAGHPKLKASVSVTYTPRGGSPRTTTAGVTLVR